MLPISKLRSVAWIDTKPGNLFFPRKATDEKFVIGSINDFVVGVSLDRFSIVDVDRRASPRGYILESYDVSVDPASSFFPEGGDGPLGSLMLHGGNVFIFARAKEGSEHVLLQKYAEVSEPVIGFSHWQITMPGTDPNLFTIFEHNN